MANNKAIVIGLKHIELLCAVLFCEPNDLFSWTADNKYQLAKDHPLQKMTNQETVEKNFQEIFSTMPFKQLKELTKTLEDNTVK